MNNKLTDAQIIEAIEHVFATEHDDADAIAKVRQILAPANMDELLDALVVMVEALDRMREPKPTRGTIQFEGAVIELPDEEN